MNKQIISSIDINTSDITNNSSSPELGLNDVINTQHQHLKELLFNKDISLVKLGTELLKKESPEVQDSLIVDNSNIELNEVIPSQSFYLGFGKNNENTDWSYPITFNTAESAFTSVSGFPFKKIVKITLNK